MQQWAEDEEVPNFKLPGDGHIQELLAKDDFHVWVALVDNLVVGGLTAYELIMFDEEKKEMFLYEMGVIKAHRKKGIATRLIEVLKQFCSSHGIPVIFVGTSMDNEAARRLYTTTGGEIEIGPWYTYNL